MSETLDLRGLKCPLPALVSSRKLAHLAPGTLLTVLATDPMASLDLPHMCHKEGHAYEGMTAHDGYNEFQIRSGSASPPHPDQAG